ncbi:protein VASCULAR ASSOCIATED DEATH 1 [Cucumis melo var. makuwa]|uniref:Protein VASCULAR ASSOCIATED DEATH 1 n=1 Tax=Cucumis melo var. makuwa TaxID=1194695 RepID=A0A5D3DB36_CUCMM|nr:protein VASCULAR ASSOCIATED DEATH 1 [Cucumis melo var. makuwa]TYK20758.1 protein VASCULAR ASSOCIATED DEATH 1 [Cucumis melo var. makuwa]
MAAAASAAAPEIIELPRPRDKLPTNLSPDSASCYPPESSSSSADRISDTHESSSSPDGFHEDVEIQVHTATSLLYKFAPAFENY